MSFKAYEEYKDSGVEWLGEVPMHWDVAPIQKHYSLCNGYPFKAELFSDSGKPENRLIRIRDILSTKSHIYTNESCPEDASINNGDVLIGMDGDFNVSFWNQGTAKLNQRVCALRGNDSTWDRFLYLGITQPLKVINDLTFSTTVKHLASHQVLKTQFPIPPERELMTIVNFLDHETARIDALIEEQQRLIALLKEKRQAVISHAVTKGLDPNVPMKDSGVEWLGDVPAHWQIKRVKNILQPGKDSIRPGPFGSDIKGNDFVEESDYRVYNQSTVISRDFNNSAFITKEKFESLISFMVKKGDILITSRGTIGKISEVDSDAGLGIIHPCIIRLRLNHHIVLTSFFTLMFSQTTLATDQLKVASNSTTIDVIYANSLSETWIPLPPKHEQQDIYDKLSGFLSSTNQTIDTAEQLSNLLQERRSALISAAVTGKIDVRDWQPPEASQTAAEPAEASA